MSTSKAWSALSSDLHEPIREFAKLSSELCSEWIDGKLVVPKGVLDMIVQLKFPSWAKYYQETAVVDFFEFLKNGMGIDFPINASVNMGEGDKDTALYFLEFIKQQIETRLTNTEVKAVEEKLTNPVVVEFFLRFRCNLINTLSPSCFGKQIHELVKDAQSENEKESNQAFLDLVKADIIFLYSEWGQKKVYEMALKRNEYFLSNLARSIENPLKSSNIKYPRFVELVLIFILWRVGLNRLSVDDILSFLNDLDLYLPKDPHNDVSDTESLRKFIGRMKQQGLLQ